MPILIKAIPINDILFGFCSPKYMAIKAVKRNEHEFAIGTAIDNSDSCKVYTYRRLPH